MSNELKRIAVYGSLRKGMGNHRLIKDAQYVDTHIVSLPMKMISYGAFPALIPSQERHEVVIETYDLNPREYADVERLEGYPHFYDKYEFTEPNGQACEIYFVPKDTDTGAEHIVDWVKYKSNR